MEEPKYLQTNGILLDLSDEQKIPFSQALLSGAEYDDTFGLYNNNQSRSLITPAINGISGKGSGSGGNHRRQQQKREEDENGNPLDSSLDFEIFDIATVSEFPSYQSMEFEDEVYAELKSGLKGKIRAIKQLAWEAEQDMPNPVIMSGKWTTEEGKERIRMLKEGAAGIMEIWNKIKSEKHYFDEPGFTIPLLEWGPSQIRDLIQGRSRAEQIASEIRELLENPPPPPVTSRPQVSPPPLSIQNDVTDTSQKAPIHESPSRGDVTPISAPPSPTPREPAILCKDTSLSLRSLASESSKPSSTLRRTQSCATSRQFIPPIASSSPRPMRGGDLNRSTSTDSANSLQRQNSFKRTIASVKSSGYGRPSLKKAPPSPGPRCLPSPIRASSAGVRSRASLGLMGSPQRDSTSIPSRQYSRGSPARLAPKPTATTTTAATNNTKQPDLDSTFTKGNTSAAHQPRFIRPPSSTPVVCLAPPDRPRNNGKLDTSIQGLQVKASAVPVSKLPAPVPVTKKEDISKMLNKFGFRK